MYKCVHHYYKINCRENSAGETTELAKEKEFARGTSYSVFLFRSA